MAEVEATRGDILPLEVRTRTEGDRLVVYLASGVLIIADDVYATHEASDHGLAERKANAEYIARAVNSLDANEKRIAELREALRLLLNGLPVFPDTDDPHTRISAHHLGLLTVGQINAARAALEEK